MPIKYFVEVYEHTLLKKGAEGCRASSADDAHRALSNTLGIFFIGVMLLKISKHTIQPSNSFSFEYVIGSIVFFYLF